MGEKRLLVGRELSQGNHETEGLTSQQGCAVPCLQ
jgi:hypothetical protein